MEGISSEFVEGKLLICRRERKTIPFLSHFYSRYVAAILLMCRRYTPDVSAFNSVSNL